MNKGPSRRAILVSAGAAVAAKLAPAAAGPSPASAQGTTGTAGVASGAQSPAYRTVGEMRAMLDTRQVSATELLDQAIARIEEHDGRINAVVVRDFERARAAAQAADAALARGERRPLLGIPMTVKESIHVAGLPATWGFPAGRDWRPPEDAVAVARLKAAGAVILGKTNVPTGITAFWETRNAVYGETNNPWDLGRTPGGSSGGPAAALAAGYVPLELATDAGGSLRGPAHFCGVFGHKPSVNLVPGRGHSPPRAPVSEYSPTGGFAVVGPMARSAADLATALDLLAGPDETDGVAYRVALPPPRHTDLRSYRVLVIDAHPLLPVHEAMRAALHRLADRLDAAGAAVARSSPLLPDLAEVARLRWRFFGNLRAFGTPPEFLQQVRERVAALAPDDNSLRAVSLRAALSSHHEWMASEAQRARLRAQWHALCREFDVVLCPPFWGLAPAHDRFSLENWEDHPFEVDGRSYPYIMGNVWSTIATTLGLPSTVAPNGRSESGLPIGVEIIGPFLEDRTSIAFAGLIEREFGGFVPPPGFA